MKLNIRNETSTLKSVIVGIADSNGGIPESSNVYDPKSRKNISLGTYPIESDMVFELNNFVSIIKSHNVEVLRPKIIKNYNQIFSRDIGFVIGDKFVKSNILPLRSMEIDAINFILEKINPNSIITLPEDAHIEGGDVILCDNKIFVGAYVKDDYSTFITARTNLKAIEFLQEIFPDKEFILLELNKSNIDPKYNILHLDCCFQPIGKSYAIIHKEGFSNKSQLNNLIDFFGRNNCFFIDADEMSEMTANIFSIDSNTVISDSSFHRLNNWMKIKGFNVEIISFREIAKQEGLFRCVTLPLNRIS